MESSQKKLTIVTIIILLASFIAILIFSNLTEDVSNVLLALEEGKIQSQILNPDFSDSDKPSIFPDKPEAIAAFWEIDIEGFEKGGYIGVAVIKDNKIYINVKHPNLKAILKSPYKPIEIAIEGATPPYQPGTAPHLKAIVKESWRWQYTAEYKD